MAAAKKRHNGKILLPYEDRLQTSLLYRILDDQRNPLDVGFQVFKSWSSRLLLPPFPLKIFSLVSGKKDRQTTIQWHVLKKTHNGKILLPYDDNLETSLLYRMLEDIRNTRGRFPSLQKLEPQIAAAAAVFLQLLFLVNGKEDRQTAMWWQHSLKKHPFAL